MLPFIAGALVGAIAVVAVNNRKKIIETVSDTVSNAKDNIVDAGNVVKEKLHDMTSESVDKVEKAVKEEKITKAKI